MIDDAGSLVELPVCYRDAENSGNNGAGILANAARGGSSNAPAFSSLSSALFFNSLPTGKRAFPRQRNGCC